MYYPTLSTWLPWRRWAVILVAVVAFCSFTLPTSAIDQAPIVSVGESNSPVQREEVLDLLNAAAPDQVVTVSVDETVQAMGSVFDMSGIDSAYSSTALTCETDGAGISIKTRNIEMIPPELYALALLTSGMSNVDLVVAAPSDAPALGMTAMTGVFKTWDMATCPGSGTDPARRQLALEQLALIAPIGQTPEAIRQLTRVVLGAEQEMMANNPTTDQLRVIVASGSETAGLDLTDEDLAAIVGFLDDLSQADADWGEYADGWSMLSRDNGASVNLSAHPETASAAANRAMPAGVGGVTGPITAAPPPAITASPIAMIPPNVPSNVTPTPAVSDHSGPSIMGTVLKYGREAGRWWPLAVVGVALLLLGIGARLQPSERPQTWYVSRSRIFWLGRTLRRPAIVQVPRRKRHVVTFTKR